MPSGVRGSERTSRWNRVRIVQSIPKLGDADIPAGADALKSPPEQGSRKTSAASPAVDVVDVDGKVDGVERDFPIDVLGAPPLIGTAEDLKLAVIL